MGQERIIGVGVDILDINRIAADLTEYPNTFADEFCSPEEIVYCNQGRGRQRIQRYAVFWVVKESVIKALGGGGDEVTEPELDWREIVVKKRKNGQPYIDLRGRAHRRAEELGVTSLLLSYAHEKNMAIAFCVATGVFS